MNLSNLIIRTSSLVLWRKNYSWVSSEITSIRNLVWHRLDSYLLPPFLFVPNVDVITFLSVCRHLSNVLLVNTKKDPCPYFERLTPVTNIKHRKSQEERPVQVEGEIPSPFDPENGRCIGSSKRFRSFQVRGCVFI